MRKPCASVLAEDCPGEPDRDPVVGRIEVEDHPVPRSSSITGERSAALTT